jgi:hypothetical protein
LGFLAGLHPLWHDVGEPPLADHLQDVLAVELSVHQHVIVVDEVLGRVKQVLNDLLPWLAFPYRAGSKNSSKSVGDTLV